MALRLWLWMALAVVVLDARSTTAASLERPNVVLVMIDDMGHGDLSCHGSPYGRTPHLDRLHATSVRLVNFHVAPMCSPTRGQLLSGLDAMRNGSTIVASSRMMVRRDVPLLPEHLRRAGYATGLFGKWHLGENYPHRPEDRGFEEAVWFPLQEIGSLSDYWCNDYFDPVFRRRRGEKQRFTGYCTDILFDQAFKWMDQVRGDDKPFFCYLPLNVAHGPQWAPAESRAAIARQFPKLSPGQVGYLAMLETADRNVGRLEEFLVARKLRDNTLVIFLSDNGGYALVGLYNSGMRDGKSRLAEGGHRVPCFLRYPAGGIGGNAGLDQPGLAQVQDLLPTILDVCGVTPISGPRWDGISLGPALRGQAAMPERTLIVQYGPPRPFHMACVLEGPWRLLSDIKGPGRGQPELYNLEHDPLQQKNLIQKEPARAAQMRASYHRWWSEVEPMTRQRASITVGHPAQPKVVLNSAEWRENAMAGVVGLRQGVRRRGVWDIEVARDGVYELALRRWPEEANLALTEAAPAWSPRDRSTPDHLGYAAGVALPIATAEARIGGAVARQNIDPKARAVVIRMPLKAGQTELEGFFRDTSGKPICSAFFVDVRRVEP